MSPRPPGPLPAEAAAPHDAQIVRPDGRTLTARLYPATGHDDGTPLVLHLHGGAFVGGTLEDGAAIAALLVEAGAAVVSLDYPLAPAHPFPAAVEAAYDALGWAHRQRRRLAGSQARLFVAGEDAGGNLAAAVAMLARDRAGPALAGQILLSPMLDPCVATASQRDANAGPVGCRCTDGWRAYLARCDDVQHPYAVPGRSMRLAGLPPTLLVTAADDPLRDETQAFHHRLQAAGVPAGLLLFGAGTGWPPGHRHGREAPWAAPLRARLHRFLATTAATSTPP